MRVYLGVSRNLSFLDYAVGQKNFWCVYSNSQPAQPGDLLLLYIPVKASQTRNGIGQIYKIITTPQGGRHAECADRMMSSVETELLLNLDSRITIKDMKRDKVVRQWGALGRNLQGVTFSVPEHIWAGFKAIIIDRNPKAHPLLS
jgi:hypothetical protein